MWRSPAGARPLVGGGPRVDGSGQRERGAARGRAATLPVVAWQRASGWRRDARCANLGCPPGTGRGCRAPPPHARNTSAHLRAHSDELVQALAVLLGAHVVVGVLHAPARGLNLGAGGCRARRRGHTRGRRALAGGAGHVLGACPGRRGAACGELRRAGGRSACMQITACMHAPYAGDLHACVPLTLASSMMGTKSGYFMVRSNWGGVTW